MRKIPAALTVLAMAALGTVVPASAAHAAPSCATAYEDASRTYMYAYSSANCVGFLGKAKGNDLNWGDSGGSFQGGDTNKATSVLNRGTDVVQFFNGTGTDWTGGNICLKSSERFASSLADNDFSSGVSANDAISSHRWVLGGACDAWAT
ncbi:hypothetical protein ACFVTT_17990 [Streptomyces niveus]|uniref:hypothetical protein n=1 Tax=Streptomyces niveus TaxID=193462 RepID=UPI0034420DAC